jgi:hypothetical protein
MKKHLSRRIPVGIALTLTLLIIFASPFAIPKTHAQQGQLRAGITTFYRFRVSNSSLGYMLTGIPERGTNLNYSNEGSVALAKPGAGIVLPPAANYTPAAGEPLVPLYQWRVVQGSRTYYYYATQILSLGSNYYFEGLVGYVLPSDFPDQQQRSDGTVLFSTPLNYYYSQSYGYWYTVWRPELGGSPECFPDRCNPDTSFRFQGVGFKLPTQTSFIGDPNCLSFNGCPRFLFNPPPPPPPPPTCDPEEQQACISDGGRWRSSTCSCVYLNTLPTQPE